MTRKRAELFRQVGMGGKTVEKKEKKKEGRTFEKPEVVSCDREELEVEKAFTGSTTGGM